MIHMVHVDAFLPKGLLLLTKSDPGADLRYMKTRRHRQESQVEVLLELIKVIGTKIRKIPSLRFFAVSCGYASGILQTFSGLSRFFYRRWDTLEQVKS